MVPRMLSHFKVDNTCHPIRIEHCLRKMSPSQAVNAWRYDKSKTNLNLKEALSRASILVSGQVSAFGQPYVPDLVIPSWQVSSM